MLPEDEGRCVAPAAAGKIVIDAVGWVRSWGQSNECGGVKWAIESPVTSKSELVRFLKRVQNNIEVVVSSQSSARGVDWLLIKTGTTLMN